MRRRYGIFRSAWYWLVGQPDRATQNLRHARNHGKVLMAVARIWSLPLLVAFSVGALVTLAGAPLQDTLTRLQARQPLDWVAVIVVIVTLLTVVGFDLTLIVACVIIRARTDLGTVWRRIWGWYALAGFIGLAEAFTFAYMIAGHDHPANGAAWVLVAIRSIGAPICSVVLALASPPAVTEQDLKLLLQQLAGEGLYGGLVEAIDTGSADLPGLFQFFGTVNDYRDGESLDGWIERVQVALARLAPDAVRLEMDRALVEARQEADAARTALAEARASAADLVAERITKVLLHLFSTGELPGWLLEQSPDLAEIPLPQIGGAKTRRIGAPRAVDRGPKDRTEAIVMLLDNLGIARAKTPPKGRGVWVNSAGYAALSDGRYNGDAATKQVRNLGDSAKDGTSYIAAFDAVMRDLYDRHALVEAARNWWETSGFGLALPVDNTESYPGISTGAESGYMRTNTTAFPGQSIGQGGRIVALNPADRVG